NRSSSMTSPSVMASLPTTTATRSSTAAAAVNANRRLRQRMRISEGLPDGEEELKMTHMLNGGSGSVKQELLIGAGQAVEGWRVDAISKVKAHGPQGRAVAHAESGGMHHVIEIRQAVLVD